MANPRHMHGTWMNFAIDDTLIRATRLLLCSSSGRRRRGRGGRRGCLGRGRRQTRIEPAGVNAAVQRFLRFGIDISLAYQAAEGRLDMCARATEAVIEVQVAEGGIEVVAPEQTHDPAAKPDGLRGAGRPGKG